MQRLTNKENSTLIDNIDIDIAIARLAKFETMYEDIVNGQDALSKEMEILRIDGKSKTMKFKELMIKKLKNLNFINAYEFYKIK